MYTQREIERGSEIVLMVGSERFIYVERERYEVSVLLVSSLVGVFLYYIFIY